VPAVLVIAAVVDGRTPEWRAFHADLAGPRRAEWVQSQRRRGIKREVIWLTDGSDGSDGAVSVTVLEGEDPGASLRHLESSNHPFDVWYRERWGEVHVADSIYAEPIFDTKLGPGLWRGWMGWRT
jgi:hypothetical protein